MGGLERAPQAPQRSDAARETRPAPRVRAGVPDPAALAGWLPRQRWFASKARRIERIDVEDWVPIAPGGLAVVAATLDDGALERYAVPLLAADEPADALDDPGFARALLDLIATDGGVRGEDGDVAGSRTTAFPSPLPADLAPHRLKGEQSNTSVRFGDTLILKHFRRLATGVNPEREISRFLTERTAFRATPRLAGDLEYRPRAGEPMTLAVLQELVPGAEDGWRWMLSALEHGDDALGTTIAALRELGQRTAELHVALASDARDPAFAPEPIGEDDLARWVDGIGRQVDAAHRALRTAGDGAAPDVAAALAGLAGRHKIRHHGDFHLGQTLRREDGGFVIIDFEGEPARALEERRRKHAALRDVAGMLRSIDYAAASAKDVPRDWVDGASAAFVTAYRQAAGAASFLPVSSDAFDRAVAAFVLEKAAYEVVYEANNRPDWIHIPERGLARAAAALRATR